MPRLSHVTLEKACHDIKFISTIIPNAWSRHPGNGHPYISTQSGTIVLIVSIDLIIDLNPFSYKVSTKSYFCFQKKNQTHVSF